MLTNVNREAKRHPDADSKFALQFLDATPARAYDLIANQAGPLKKALDERNAVLKSANQA